MSISKRKTYLNKKEKNDILVLASFKVFMDEYAQKMEDLKKPKDAIKYTRMARSFTNKVMKIQMEDLRSEEQQKVLNEVRKMRVAIHYRDDALKEFEKMKKIDSVTPIDTEDLLDLCASSLEICMKCKKVGEAADSCNLRRIYFKYDIEPLDLYAPEGKCQYQY